MAIQQDQFQATPYTSTVPLVQVPPQAIEQQSRPAAPLQGEFGGHKGTGGLLIGDALLKGFMAGHQQKEQKQQAKAQATINAADAASEGAYRAYQDALTKAGGKQDDPAAQAAYQSYVATFQAGKQAKAQYVIPDKTQKGKKAAGDTDPVKSPDDKKKKNPVSAGFNNIGEFFAANPHIVPQIALLTMQPKPQGLSTEGQQQVQSLESGKISNEKQALQLQNEKTYQSGFSTFSHLSPDEVAALPPDAKKNYDVWQNARAAIAPTKYSGTTKLYQLSNGKKAWLHPEEASEYYPDAQPVESTGIKPGSDAELEDKWFKDNGLTRDTANAEQLASAKQYAKAAGIVPTATTSTSTSDPLGNRTTTTSRKATAGGIQPPPSASRKASTASGGLGAPPTAGASPSGQGAPGTALSAGTGKPGSPLNPYPNPEDQPGETSFAFNQSWAKPGPYLTKLSPDDEAKFQKWMKDNPGIVNQNDLDNPQSGYDTRGWWQAGQNGDPLAKRVRNAWDGKMHSSDKWKTPYNGTFSNESMYATPGAPRWNGDSLVTADGRVVTDETPKRKPAAAGQKTQGMPPPPQGTKTAKAGMAPPPRGKETALTASVTRQAVKAQQEGYRKAETGYTNAIGKADKQYIADVKAADGNPTLIKAAEDAKSGAYGRALFDREQAKKGVAAEYDTAVKSIGGESGNQSGGSLPPGWL